MRRLGVLLTPVRRVVSIFRTTRRTVATVPDALDAILLLPVLARQLEEIRFSTATLPEMHAEIARVRGDTAVLPGMHAEIAGIREDTDALRRMDATLVQLAEIALPLGRFTGRIPQRRVRNGGLPR